MTEITAIPQVTPSTPFWQATSWQGAFWKVVSCAAFAGINGMVRFLSKGSLDGTVEALPVNVLMFFQNVFGALFLLPWILKAGVFSLKTKAFGLHLWRVVLAVSGIYLWYLSLKAMPIAQGLSLNFTGPIFTVIAAWFLLQERLTFNRFLAIFLSLVGAFIISRPDLAFHSDTKPLGWAVLLPIGSALVIAFSKIFTRKLANSGESSTTLATYLLVLMIPVSLLPALYEWTMPNANHWPWLIGLGFLATTAHLSFAKAYKLAEVTFLTPFGFSKFLISTLVGFLAFSEIPSPALWLGTAVIFASILILGFKNYKIPLYSIANRFKSS